MITEEKLKLIADKFSEQQVVKGLLHAFDDNSWIDPLTLWSLRGIGDRQIEWLIVLLDWMPDADAGKPSEGVEITSTTARTTTPGHGRRRRRDLKPSRSCSGAVGLANCWKRAGA
jgi:hypothetical protein